MGQQEIYEWIAKARSSGLTDDQITAQLKSSGWNDSQIVQILGSRVAPQAPAVAPSQANPAYASPSAATPAPAKKSRVGLIVGICIAVIVLAAAGVAFAAWKGYVTVPILSPYFTSLESDAIEKAFTNMANVRGQEVTVNLSFDGEPRAAGAKPIAVEGNSSDQVFSMIPGDAKVSMALTVFAKNTTEVKTIEDITKTEALMSMGVTYQASGTTLSGKGEMRMKDGTMYVQLSEMPNLGLVDFSQFTNKWYSVNMAKALENNPLANSAFSNVNSIQAQTWQPEVSALYRAARETDFLTFDEVGKEDVAGSATTKYKIVLDPDKMQQFADSYHQDAKKRNVSIKEIDDMLTDWLKPATISEMKDFLNTGSLNVWVTKDPYIAKVAVETVIVPPDSDASLKDRQFRLTVSMAFGKFNQQPVVEVPQGATDLMQFLGDTRQEARDDTRKNDLRQLRTALALYYDDTQAYPSSLDVLSPNYIHTLPVDPLTGFSYHYSQNATGVGYEVCAVLDGASSFCLRMADGVVTETPNTTDTSLPADSTSNQNTNTTEEFNFDAILNSNVNSETN